MNNGRIQAVLFDLDGTLLNTIADLAACMNRCLAEENLPTHPLADHNFMVGDGVRNYILRALPEDRRDDAELYARIEPKYRALYAEHWADNSGPYEGVKDMLAELCRRSLRLAVLSNKPDGFTREMVDHYFGPWSFEIVRGAMPNVPLKPDPTPALQLAGQMGLTPGQFAYVGDTSTDMQTGRGAGMFTVGVTWGFRPREELIEHGAERIIDAPTQLPDLLNGK